MTYFTDPVIDWIVVEDADEWLDRSTSPDHLIQTLAQDWARLTKIAEEFGEAAEEMTLLMGANPRKDLSEEDRDAAYQRFLLELGDVVMTAVLAIQHFTKDSYLTRKVVKAAVEKVRSRIPE